ncbi:molybdopterin-dependent oxidoreductase [Raoultella ornithinolytica]|uniref:molybdopterin-dependent oxidoreductase n=1 Tax=Raoultella ornithinolytica TaxID=54291 RepID=UPI0025B5F3DC|nr:molybdopterin-dependent oxidoreductase [Raoultella ornithinolytica]MDN3782779.1 molybdopterin-dependent oxidoreductase [Raoultella ornithinolytica]
MTKIRRGGRRVILPSTSWGEHEGVHTAADRGFQRFFKAVEPKWDLKPTGRSSAKSPPEWAIRCTTTTPRRSGTSCGIFVPDFYGATYEKKGELGYVMGVPR